MGGHARPLDDLVDFAHPLGSLRAIASHVGDVDAVVGHDRFAERRDLAGVGIEAGDVIESRRQPDRPGVHTLADEPLHRIEFAVRRGPGVEPHDLHPDVAVGDEVGHVDGRGAIEAIQVLVDTAPGVVESRRVAVEPRRVTPHVVERRGRGRREGAAVLANDVGGDALPQGRQVNRVGQEHQVAMHVHVDEAGDDIPPGHVDLAWSRRPVEPPDLGDHGLQERHVGPIGRTARAVNHPAVLEDQVEGHGSSLVGSRQQAAAE